MTVTDIFDRARETINVRRAYGEPYEKNGVTVIPAARVSGGSGGGEGTAPEGKGEGSGGGMGVMARPVGALVIREGRVSWVPAVDVTRIVLAGQVVAIVALLTIRSVVKYRSKRVG
jgi:uncharacterized spore protein YtfJ